MTEARLGNVPLRTVRESRGYTSQQDFAAALNAVAREHGLGELSITSRTVRRWESAKPPRPQHAHAQALELLLDCPIEDLGLTPRAERGTSEAAAAQPAGSPLPQAPAIRDAVNDDAITQYQALTSTYRALCRSIPALALLPSITSHALLGDSLVAAANPTQRPDMARPAAQAWLLAGRIELFDNNSAPRCCAAMASALDYAHACADEALAAAILAHIALAGAAKEDSSIIAAEQIRMARAFARRAHNPAELDAWLDITEAQIALSNSEIQHAMALIAAAEAALQRRGPALDWLDWLTPHRIAGLKASILLADGRTVEARSTLDHAARELPDALAKPRALLYADMSEIAAFEGDPEKAADLLATAIDTAAGAGQRSVAPRILEARRALNQWDDSPAIAALDDHLTQWRPALGVLQ